MKDKNGEKIGVGSREGFLRHLSKVLRHCGSRTYPRVLW